MVDDLLAVCKNKQEANEEEKVQSYEEEEKDVDENFLTVFFINSYTE